MNSKKKRAVGQRAKGEVFHYHNVHGSSVQGGPAKGKEFPPLLPLDKMPKAIRSKGRSGRPNYAFARYDPDSGELARLVLRADPEGQKKITAQRFVNEDGSLVSKKSKLSPKARERCERAIFFNLPAVLAAMKNRDPSEELPMILIFEGELKTLRAVEELGILAIAAGSCNALNETAADQLMDLFERFPFRVALVPDGDEEGLSEFAKSAKLLANRGIPTELCPPLASKQGSDKEGFDIADALDEGFSRADLDVHLQGATRVHASKPPGYRLRARRASDVEPESVRWLWKNRLAFGKLTILAGDPGCGKSLLSCDLAARASAGMCAPGEDLLLPKCRVIVVNLEDGADDTIIPRLQAAGADLERIEIVDGVDFVDEAGDGKPSSINTLKLAEALRGHLRAIDEPVLIVLDPVNAFLGGKDSHKAAETREAMQPLIELCRDTGASLLAVHHLNKTSKGVAARYRLSGSIDFLASARVVLGVARLRTADEQAENGQFVFAPLKNNIGDDQSGAAYSIEPAEIESGDTQIETCRVVWLDGSWTYEDLERSLASPSQEVRASQSPKPTAYKDIECPAHRLVEALKRKNISRATIRELQRLNVPGLGRVDQIRRVLEQLEEQGIAMRAVERTSADRTQTFWVFDLDD